MFEYGACLDGYNSRDKMAYELFYKIIQSFQIFLLIIAFTSKLFCPLNEYYRYCCLTIGAIGFLSMFSLLLGLESCSSAKIALRKRCIVLDEVLSKMPGGTHPQYWDTIRKRNKYLEEGIIKGQPTDNPNEIKEAKGIFIWAARIIIFCWVGIVIYMAFCGHLLVCYEPSLLP
jgi:hypothetical protein